MRGTWVRRVGMWAAVPVMAGMGIAALNGPEPAATMANSITAPLAPTTSDSPSIAPANPVDCNDPNNAVNCQTPPIDSPLVSGTAVPGSPFRD